MHSALRSLFALKKPHFQQKNGTPFPLEEKKFLKNQLFGLAVHR